MVPLKRFELPIYKVMLHLRGVRLQPGLKPQRRNLTHSVYSENVIKIMISMQGWHSHEITSAKSISL